MMPSNQEDRSSIDFQQYWRILKKRWLITATVIGSVFGLSVFVTLQQKPIYEAEGKLLFNKTNRVSSLTNLSEQLGELSGVTQASNPLDTEAEVIRSNPILQKTIDNLKLKDKYGQPLEIDAFVKKLKIKSVRGTDVLVISYRSHNPQEAVDVVNAIASYYLENNVRTNRAEATAAGEFLQKQLPVVESRVVQAEAALRRFKEANKVVSLEEEAKTGVESLKDLSDRISQAEADLAEATSRSQGLQRQLQLHTQQAVDLSGLSQSAGVQQVLTEYQKVQDELAVQRTRLTEEHPAIVNLLRKEEALRKQLERRVGENVGNAQSVAGQNLQIGALKQSLTEELVKSEVGRLALANRVQVLKNTYSLYQRRLGVLPQLEQKQRQLERQLEVARSTYEQLLKRFQEVEIVVNQNVGNARVVSPALVPKKPVSPKKVVNLGLGGLMGILFGVGTALLLETMDKSLKTAEEAKQLLGYPLLGSIPRLKSQKANAPGDEEELPVRDNPYSPASAAFEMLQANLEFTLSDRPLKVIVVVGSSPGEGKSFVAANLAVAKAQMGKRVLLIDADMRCPRQQAIWKCPNLMGLSNVLVGQAELANTTQEALVNLDVLTAGTIPPNPAALLNSQRMAALLEAASRDYEFVIIDTPASSLFADGLMLGKLADGLLLVVRPGVVDAVVAQSTKAMIEQSRSRVLGMVINGVNLGKNYGGYYANRYYAGKGGDQTEVDISRSRVL
jgi:polysaccharide chain length determinant protein (PEP-CTERM system associated)